jgi:hypothetical protein
MMHPAGKHHGLFFLPGPLALHDLYMVLASAWSVEFTKIKSLPSSEQQLSIMDDDRL